MLAKLMRGLVATALAIAGLSYLETGVATAQSNGLSLLSVPISPSQSYLQDSVIATLSADGQWAVFASARPVVPGAGGSWEIYARNTSTGSVEVVSAADGSTQPGDWEAGNSGFEQITPDGRYVTFEAGPHADGNGAAPVQQAFIRDRLTDHTELISVSTAGLIGDGASYPVAVSDDGRYVLFTSVADNLRPGDVNGNCTVSQCGRDAFLRDRLLGTTTFVDPLPEYTTYNSAGLAMSGDGRYIIFSRALTIAPPAGDYELDRSTGLLTAISPPASSPTPVWMSQDGQSVRFVCNELNTAICGPTPAPNGSGNQIFQRNIATGAMTQVSLASSPNSSSPSVDSLVTFSRSGRYALFQSRDSSIAGPTLGIWNVYAHDTLTGVTKRVTNGSDGNPPNAPSYPGAISDSGAVAAIGSYATNLVPGSVNGAALLAAVSWPGPTQSVVIGEDLNGPAGLAVNSAGDVFVADNNNSRIAELVPGSTTPITLPFTGMGRPTAVALDPAGDLFAADSLTELTELPAGAVTPIRLPNLGYGQPLALATDAAGDLFITTANNHVIELPAGSQGPAIVLPFTGLNTPTGIAVDAAGDVYVVDALHTRVLELPSGSSTQVVLPFDFTGTAGLRDVAVDSAGDLFVVSEPHVLELPAGSTTPIDLTASWANYPQPVDGIAIDNSGLIYLASQCPGSCVMTFRPGDSAPIRIPTVGLVGGVSGSPSVAVDPQGDVVSAGAARDHFLQRAAGTSTPVVVSAPDLGYLSAVGTDAAGNAYLISGNDVVKQTPAGAQTSLPFTNLNSPQGIAVDAAGDVYIANSNGQSGEPKLEELPAGSASAIAIPSQGLIYPRGIAVDSAGNVFVTDTGRLIEITPAGVQSIVPLTSSTDLAGLAVDAAGDIYVADRGNNQVLELDPNGVQRTLPFSGLKFPDSVAVDAAGNVYATGRNMDAVVELSNIGQPALSTQTVTFAAIADQTFGGPPVTLSATATSQLAVTYTSGTPATCTVDQAGTVNLLAAGVCTVIASQPGDGTFAAAPDVLQTFNIRPASLVLAAVSQNTTYGAPIPPLTWSLTGFVNGDTTTSATTGAPACTTPATSSSPVGSYPITCAIGTLSAPNYAVSAFAPGVITVSPSSSGLMWSAPPPITFGAALSTSQLDATASVPGTFVYTPTIGAALGAGPHTLSVTFTPVDSVDYATATSTVTLQVNKAAPLVSWATPAQVTYGTPLSAAQLNATASVPGTFSYSPSAGAALAVGSHTLTATFAPTDGADYDPVSSSVTLQVGAATPVLTWPAPTPISYGTALSGTQLNATASVPGTFTYSPALGTVLAAGARTLTVTFTPTDALDYLPITASVGFVVNKAPAVINWGTPATVTYGTALSATQLNATASVPGTFNYSPALGTVLSAGSRTLSVVFTPTDAADYTAPSASVTLQVAKATPALTWVTPSNILYGTPLSATQLDPHSSVPGTFSFTPKLGLVLQPGTQTLAANFAPTDATDYNSASVSTALTVGFSQTCITTTRSGPFTVSAGQSICMSTGGSLVGPVSVATGGVLWINGGSITGPVTTSTNGQLWASGSSITGPMNSTGASAVTMCASRITGPIAVSGAKGAVLIGGAGCAANTITGAVSITVNTGGVSFVGNKVTGPLTIQNNSGGFQYSGNTVTGSVTVSGNS